MVLHLFRTKEKLNTMKKLILFFGTLFMMMFTLTANAQTMDFDKMEHDYGTINQGDNGVCEFRFTNNGTEPLIIQNAKGSCGCTVPEWPKEPIAPGESNVIKVKYDTKRVGPINKSVRITTNVSDQPIVLRIKGTVKAAAGMPEKNTAGPTVKQ